jgi:hypothetical protein
MSAQNKVIELTEEQKIYRARNLLSQIVKSESRLNKLRKKKVDSVKEYDAHALRLIEESDKVKRLCQEYEILQKQLFV